MGKWGEVARFQFSVLSGEGMGAEWAEWSGATWTGPTGTCLGGKPPAGGIKAGNREQKTPALDSEIRENLIQLAKGLRLFARFFEPRDVIRIFEPFEHLLINFNRQDDRDGFAFAGHDFRFECFCFHGG